MANGALIALMAAQAAKEESAAKSIVEMFRDAGATSPGDAVAWKPTGPTQEKQFDRLREKGALVEMRPGYFYLNLDKLAGSGSGTAVLVAVVAALAAVVAVLLLLLLF